MTTIELVEEQNIRVDVETAFLEGQSNALKEQYVFSYTITISNNSSTHAVLLNRFWRITDANGDESTVSGEGVVGEQPKIMPGKSFTYSSGCILKTPLGTMEGFYEIINADGVNLKVNIPPFRLALPNILN